MSKPGLAPSLSYTALLLVLSCLPALALDSGNNAAAFLGIGFGSRAQGMANGVVALADDATATYFNPAGLAGASRELNLSHSAWIQDIALSQAAISLPRGGGTPSGGRGWTLGFAVTRLGVEGIEARRAETARPDGTFGAEDLSLGVSAARNIGPGSAGATVKLVQQRIASTLGRTVAVDLGVRLPLSPRLTAGASVRNLGPSLRLGGSAFPLPTSIHAGLAYKAPVTLAFEAAVDRDGRAELIAGTEYRLNDVFALRGGYFEGLGSANPAASTQSGLIPFPGVSAGFGLRLGKKIDLDYAIVPFRDLGSAHRVSLSMRF